MSNIPGVNYDEAFLYQVTDNTMANKGDIKRFFDGFVDLLRRAPFYLIIEICQIVGPTAWSLACFNVDNFARITHLGKYNGMEYDSVEFRLKRTQTYRKVYLDFLHRFTYFKIETPCTLIVQRMNMKGAFCSFNGAPAFEHRSKDEPNSYVLEWYDSKGSRSRREYDSKGKLVFDPVIFPCSVTSRQMITDNWQEYDSDLDTMVDMHLFGTEFFLEYECLMSGDEGRSQYVTIDVIPDSTVERDNFINSGYRAHHNMIRRKYPDILDYLVCPPSETPLPPTLELELPENY